MVSIRAGSSLHLSEHPSAKPHIWFVLTEPEEHSGKFVAVMLVTQKRYSDKTAILDVGDHPFIRRPSSVDYGSANFFFLGDIKRALQKGRCHIQEDMTDDLLQRVRDGLFKSSHTVHAIRDYCQSRFQSE